MPTRHGFRRRRKNRAWLVEESLRRPPKSRFGAALRYAGRQWVALTRFLSDPSLPLDNNIAERALRIAALPCRWAERLLLRYIDTR
jgi:transposase